MNTRYLNPAAGTILFLMLQGCEKVIEPKSLPQQDARIVINSVANTDSQLVVNVSSSKSIVSGKDYKYINDATCELYEDGVFAENLRVLTNGNYVSVKQPKANHHYTLKVSAPGFTMAEASTHVPEKVILLSTERYDTVNTGYYIYNNNQTKHLNGSTKFRIKFRDDKDKKNFYTLQPVVLLYDDSLKLLSPGANSYSHISSRQTQTRGTTLDMDDAVTVNGNEIHVDAELYLSVNNQELPPIRRIEVFLNIYSINEDQYKYQTTLFNQTTNRVRLFAEPVLVYSNVSNGMGIFSGSSGISRLIYSGKPGKR